MISDFQSVIDWTLLLMLLYCSLSHPVHLKLSSWLQMDKTGISSGGGAKKGGESTDDELKAYWQNKSFCFKRF